MTQKREDLAVIISAGTEQLASDLARAANLFRQFAKQAEASKPKSILPQIAVAPFHIAAKAVHGVTSAVRGASASMAGFAARVASTAGGMAVYSAGVAGVSGAFEQLKDSVKMAADLEQTTLAFEVMLRSADEASSMVGNLRKFAAETPFDTKGTTDAARQLMAYGVAADQVIPSLRVLGDITSGLGSNTSLGDMAYLFGTLKTQGRAFSKDIYQFTNRGVDLMGPLAKQFNVTTGEVMKLVEEGRVGFPQVARALESLRGPGGKFENMMVRQSKTMHGLWQIAKDSFDIAKTKFGQIIIEEMGLKEAATDFDSFAKRVEAGMDRVRPVVRFLGDLSKAVVQVGYEFGRASLKFGEIFGRQLDLVMPQAGEAFRSFQQILKDAANYKIDPVKVAQFSTSVGSTIINAGITLVETIYQAGKRFDESFVQPMMRMIDKLTDFMGGIDGVFSSTWMPWSTKQTDWTNSQRFDVKMPRDGMTDEDVIINWKQLRSHVTEKESWHRDGTWAQRQRSAMSLPELHSMQQQFLRRYSFDQNAFAHLNAGIVPTKELLRLAGQDEQQPRNFEDFIASMKENAKSLDALNASILESIRAEQVKKLQQEHEDHWQASLARGRREAMAKRNLQNMMQAGDFPLLGMSPLGGIGNLAMPIKQAANMDARDLNRLPFFNQLLSKHSLLSFDDTPSQSAIEAANRIRDDYDPMRKIRIEKGYLDDAYKYGLIDFGQRELGYRDLVKSAAERFGIGGPTQLASAALVGSAEDAALLANFMAGNTSRTTEELLDQLVRLTQQMVNMAAADHIAPMPRVANINP